MRVGEVLNLTGGDVEGQKLIIRTPKSDKETEVVFIPKKLADRLKDYLKARDRVAPTVRDTFYAPITTRI